MIEEPHKIKKYKNLTSIMQFNSTFTKTDNTASFDTFLIYFLFLWYKLFAHHWFKLPLFNSYHYAFISTLIKATS